MFATIIDKGAEPIRWLIIAGIAYTLAMTIWVFFETPVALPAPSTTEPGQTTPVREKANVNWILSKHLFGEAGAVEPNVVDPDEPSVETRLPLVLQSVMVSDIPEESTAVVAQKGKPGRVYKVGEELPGNATLVEVTLEQIFLRRAGIRESLPFPKSNGQGLTTELIESEELEVQQPLVRRELPSEVEELAEQTTEETIDTYRQQFEEDAEGTLNELGLEASGDGGYRIGGGANSAILQSTGLQSGDVILSINGQPVGNLQQDQQQLNSILAQGTARIEVQRGSRRFFITANIPRGR